MWEVTQYYNQSVIAILYHKMIISQIRLAVTREVYGTFLRDDGTMVWQEVCVCVCV